MATATLLHLDVPAGSDNIEKPVKLRIFKNEDWWVDGATEDGYTDASFMFDTYEEAVAELPRIWDYLMVGTEPS